MKRNIFILIITLLAITSLHAQTSQSRNLPTVNSTIAINGPKLAFDNTVHDFGVIPYKGPGSHIYVITNPGTEPLIIYNCIKGCGCTDVEWTKDPILPGHKGFVRATYDTRKIGQFSRGVDVYSNDPEQPKVNLRLKGTVLVVPGGEAPEIPATNQSKNTNNEKW